MYSYTQTSKLRRRMKTKLAEFGSKVQKELTISLNDLRSCGTESSQGIKKQLKKIMRQKHSHSDNENASDHESQSMLKKR